MKTYIADLKNDDEVLSYFLLVESPQVRTSKKGDYWSLKLADRTGEMDARVWDAPKDVDPKALKRCIIKVKGKVSEWQGQLQLSISQLRKTDQSDIGNFDIADFFERSRRDPKEMFEDLLVLLGNNLSDESPIKSLLLLILSENKDEFKIAPAAKSIHHAYIGGLLEHVLALCNASVAINSQYGLNLDLMLAACVLHDIGKVKELKYDMGNSYSVEGTLLGHIVLSLEATADAIGRIPEFTQELKVAVLHLVASHHGSLAWGSPRVPLMREAIAFHLLDMLDSRMAICDRAAKKGFNEDGMTEWVKELDGPLWKLPNQEDKDET
jgi:3'-5' exoribonuclease